MAQDILVDRKGAVALVTLNVPEKRNALSSVLANQLSTSIAQLQDDASVRALVLYGGKHFCAGGDLGSFGDSPLDLRSAMQRGGRMIRDLAGGRLPAVAAVEGNAYGAGFSIALACDFIVADETATFCAAFAKVGLVPDFALTWSLPQRVGVGRAREMLLFAEPVKGAAAQAIGLIDRLVPTGEVLESALQLAARLAATAPATVATTKALLSRYPMSLDTALGWEADTQAMLTMTEDFNEGVQAFRQKRDPTFKGK